MVEAPLGIFQAKCDEKGRLKLPADFSTYLKALAGGKGFHHHGGLEASSNLSANRYGRAIKICSRTPGDNAEIAEDVAFIANLYGGVLRRSTTAAEC